MVLMFSAIRKVGDKMGGWSTLDDDDDDILLASVKAKKARQRRRREAKQAMKTRPRKTLILLSFFILAVLSSMKEGLLLIISAVGTGNSARLAKEQDTWSLIGSVLAYAAYSLNVAATPRSEIAGSMLFKIAAGLSVAFNVAGLACMLALAFLGKPAYVSERISLRLLVCQ